MRLSTTICWKNVSTIGRKFVGFVQKPSRIKIDVTLFILNLLSRSAVISPVNSPPGWSCECWAMCLSLHPWLHFCVNCVHPKQVNRGVLHKAWDGCFIISARRTTCATFTPQRVGGSGTSRLRRTFSTHPSAAPQADRAAQTQSPFAHTELWTISCPLLPTGFHIEGEEILRIKYSEGGRKPKLKCVFYVWLIIGILTGVMNPFKLI